MAQNSGNITLAGLSISEDGPNLTSRTPPPPGFKSSAHCIEREKSTSFNNLAMALGTGLAESMDNSTSDALSQQQGMEQKRAATPSNVDNYTRQSRHLASRLVGGANSAGTGGLVSGFDYLNPSEFLIPPINSSFLDKLKADREAAFRQNHRSVDGELGTSRGGNDFVSSTNQKNGATNQQQPQRPMVFTAAMMAQAQSNASSDAFQLLQNSSSGLSNNPGNYNQSGLDTSQHLLTQELLRHQMWQQSNQTDSYKANTKPIGVTVVEPSSRNSPAPRTLGVNGEGLLYPMRGNFVPNAGIIGSGALGALSEKRADAYANKSIGNSGSADLVLGNGAVDFAGGRASAPPTNSQQGRGVINVGLSGGNNAAIRAYQASSLQMRVAELHQELGAGGGNNVPINLRTMSSGNVIVLATPPPPHSQVIKAPSREATPMDRNTPRPSMPSNSVANPTPNHTARVSPEQRERERAAVEELAPYLRDPPQNQKGSSSSNSSSRGVAILYASMLHVPDVRSTCEAFGALESFRSDFAETKGVYFVTFYDLRSARLAVSELPKALNQMVSSTSKDKIEVKHCVPLNSSSATDESMLLLSNLPGTIDEQDLSHSMSSFGEIRAVHYQANLSDDDYDRATYLVEFYDIQDARQALLELEQTNAWGEGVSVKVGSRNPTKRKQGRDLLMLISSWRQGQQVDSGNNFVSPSPSSKETGNSQKADSSSSSNGTGGNTHGAGNHLANHQYNVQNQDLQQYSTQLVVGPEGNFMYVLVPNQPQVAATQGVSYGFPGQMVIDPHSHQQQQFMYTPGNQQFMHNPQIQLDPQQYQLQYNSAVPTSTYGVHVQDNHAPPTQYVRLPSEINTWNSGSLSSGSGQSPHGQRLNSHNRMSAGKSTASNGSGSSSGNNAGEDENASLSLHIEAVMNGRDRRSSLMVRNIPNKYTQKMLLTEFAEAGHGSDKMDFFYLPIDFKNKCNRGYAFVNFVDYKDIIPFYDAYNGRSWSRFNSDKICDITYARIQGKAAMVKRFENSALMEKDDEYRPMIFVSHGERKGQLEAMSAANMR
ncbi:hypothetical protein HJC23_013323 [Cyclotella cryptica]|uniref:RRM domain-containing protein n=1 Tax=Cyclotella cryptica TaxID=29204 RepID=A0ABD3Q2L2_9STRA